MPLSAEKMAEFMVDEMLDDLERLVNWTHEFEDRWTKYGEQYKEFLNPEKREQVEARVLELLKRMPPSD